MNPASSPAWSWINQLITYTVAEAALALGVDVAGVELCAPAELLFEGGPGARGEAPAGVPEVNALPALHLHALPTRGRGRPVFEAFVAYCLQLPGAPEVRARVLVRAAAAEAARALLMASGARLGDRRELDSGAFVGV